MVYEVFEQSSREDRWRSIIGGERWDDFGIEIKKRTVIDIVRSKKHHDFEKDNKN